ncbi:hypothetical protein ACTMU2_27460 [Cupriavidus basilensis]
MTWPTAYGGHGLTLREHLAVNKGKIRRPAHAGAACSKLHRRGTGRAPIIMTVAHRGTEAGVPARRPAPCARVLVPGLLGARRIGSDLARLRHARAVARTAGTGASMARRSGPAVRPRRTTACCSRTGTVADKHRGLLMFAVPMNTAGHPRGADQVHRRQGVLRRSVLRRRGGAGQCPPGRA